ncbi:hypothetical protein RQP46_003102 [Phenoliferia psychrophenolica]
MIPLDLPPSTLLLLSAVLPLPIFALSHLSRFTPSVLRSPSDGTPRVDSENAPKGVRGARERVLAILSLSETVVWMGSALWGLLEGHTGWEDAGASTLVGLWWMYAGVIILARPPLSTPMSLVLFSLLEIIGAAMALLTTFLHPPKYSSLAVPILTNAFHLAASLGLLYLVGTYPLTYYPPTPPSTEASTTTDVAAVEDPEEKNRISLPSPESSVTLLSWCSFEWVAPLIQKGNIKGRLEYRDVWSLPSTMTSEGVRASARTMGWTRLVARIFFNNSLDLTMSLVLGVSSSFKLLPYASPYFLKQILTSLGSDEPGVPNDPAIKTSAYIYATLALLAQLLRAEVDLQALWHERRASIRCRTQLMGEVYEKALKRRDLSGVVEVAEKKPDKDAKGKKTKEEPKRGGGSTGKIVQVQLLIGGTFLYQLLGWTALAGFSVLLISLPLNHFLMSRRVRLHRFVLAARDKRMDVLNEFVQAIRFIKYSASEKHWLQRVFSARNYELACFLRIRLNNVLINTVWILSPDFVMLVAFACFTKILKQELTVPIAFTSLALFALVREPMNSLPSSFTSILQTYVSVERLEAFMSEPEVEPWVSSLRPDEPTAPLSSKVGIEHGTFRYQDTTTNNKKAAAPSPIPIVALDGVPQVEEEAFELQDINVVFPEGKLSLICGPTGSGKTSVLLALLGEMDCVEGEVFLPKAPAHAIDEATGLFNGCAYAGQLPWLQHASIKQNILFGTKLEQERYDAVLDACALRPDLAMFEARDEAEIGEKGLTLSGGQKARVALARAIYSRAKTVLLDDPLSAVDMHTARHLFQKCLKGPLMSGRTIILITHHITLTMSGADFLVQMLGGRIALQGPVDELDKSAITSELVEEPQEEEDVEAIAEATLEPAAEVPPTETPSAEAAAATLENNKLVKEEGRATGRVKLQVYKTYLSAGGWWTWLAIILLSIIGRFSHVGAAVLQVITVLTAFQASFGAARSLFERTLIRVSRAPFRYYDTTPTGRIINRFSTDFGIVDMAMTDQIRSAMAFGMAFLVNVGVIIVSFGETLHGITVVRAFGSERRFLQQLHENVNKMLATQYAFQVINRYLLFRFDCIGALAVATTTYLALLADISPGMAALAITSSQTLVQSVYWLCRMVTELEADLNAVERVTELLNVPQEPPLEIEATKPPAYWPSDKGGITVEDLVISYAPKLPPVIKGISFTLNPREKVGLCTIGLQDLRGALTLIPQEAVLFSGTLRENLDQFDEHTDEECRDVLERVHMVTGTNSGTATPLEPSAPNSDGEGSTSDETRVEGFTGRVVKLDTPVSAGGNNFSAGQRQLLAMARALLRRSKIIIMDEATASVDFETDAKIQHAIREEFADSLVLTIAHRLRTVIDYDRIMFLEQGQLLEFDTPRNLLLKEGGAFRKMCEQSSDWAELKSVVGL